MGAADKIHNAAKKDLIGFQAAYRSANRDAFASGGRIPTSKTVVVDGRRVTIGTAVAANSIDKAAEMGIYSTIDAVILGLTQLTDEYARVIRLWAEDISDGFESEEGFAAVNERLAQGAQAAVLDLYRKRVGRQTPIRTEGRLRGQMLKALNDNHFAWGDKTGVHLGDITMLDRVSPHWRRLNFGAGSAGASNPPQSFKFRFVAGSRGVGALRIAPQPSPAFRMPKGVWFNGNTPVKNGELGKDFYPMGLALRKLGSNVPALNVPRTGRSLYYTKGIRGAQFLDGGVKYIAENFPAEYIRLAEQYASDFRPPAIKIETDAT